MIGRMLGWSDLRQRIDVGDLGILCPVAGCGTRLSDRQRRAFIRDDKFKCPLHGIYFSPSTFEYEDELANILWDFDLLKTHTSKRESRMARDNSEDAVTWNVFRFLERGGLLLPYLSELAQMPLQEVKAIFWSHDREAGTHWEPLMAARREFELNPSKGSEPDLIVLTDRCLFIIEAKLTATNNTTPSNAKSRDKYIAGGNRWWNHVFGPGADYVQIAEHEKKFELLRFWLLGTWMADQMNPKVDFRLINLLRGQAEDEKDIEVRFRKHLPEPSKENFQRRTWESIRKFIEDKAPQSADRETILRYFREKTVGYRNGVLQKAFAAHSPPALD